MCVRVYKVEEREKLTLQSSPAKEYVFFDCLKNFGKNWNTLAGDFNSWENNGWTVDYCGMADVVRHESTGIKIPVSAYETMCANFAEQIDKICKNIGLLKMFARNIKSSSYEYSQEYRMDFFEQYYKDAIAGYKGKCGVKE